MATGKFHSKTKKVKFMGDHDPVQCNHSIGGKLIHYKPAKAWEGKDTVKLYNGDGVRELIVPKREPTENPGIWSMSEFTRLQSQARVYSKQERIAMKEEAERKKLQLQEESQKRKDQLAKAQLEQRAGATSKLATIESEAANKNLYVLQRAFELRQEQEDEIKKANGLILATKCLAIREAQIIEHELIEKVTTEENNRLDLMMEQRRQQAIKLEADKRHRKELSNQRYVKEVSQQIRENEIQRLVEAERKEEESRNINRAMIAMQQEDEEKLRQKRKAQLKMIDELAKANEEIAQYKIVQKEEQRIADMRVQEFMRNKAEREAALEAELEAQKAAKEREIARLRAQQQKAADSQAANDELNALRVQEEVEKEWREKEKREAQKRKDQNDELKRGRQKQVEDIRKAQALEIERDEHEFHQVAKVQNELYQIDLKKKNEKHAAAVRHRKELLQQINAKERERINQIKEKFEEGTALRLEQEVRSLQIEGIMKKKVQKLRDNKVPENYVRDIERALKI